MLIMTGEATTTIRNLVGERELAEGGGLRIAASEPGALSLSLALVPAEDDQVVTTDGARVFIEEQAAAVLDDKVLDATMDDQGLAHFELKPQAE